MSISPALAPFSSWLCSHFKYPAHLWVGSCNTIYPSLNEQNGVCVSSSLHFTDPWGATSLRHSLVCEQKSCYPVFVPAQKLYGIKWTKPWFKRRNSQRTECFRAITRGAYSITEGPIVDVLQLYQSYIWTLIQTRRKGMACHRDTSVHRLQRFAIFLSLRFQRCIRCGNDFLVLKNRKESSWCCFSWVVSFFWCAVPKKICQ